MNFLALLNDCIAESKQALDPLTSANFNNPPRTVLYERLKNWINQSYLDLLEERREWFFSTERGVVTLQPRLHLANIDVDYTPLVGDVLTGDVSGIEFTVTEVFFDNEGQDVTDEATISVEFVERADGNELVQWETVSAVRGIVEFDSIARIEGRGLYRLDQYIPTIDHVHMETLGIKRSVLDPEFTDDPSQSVAPLRYVDWPHYLRTYENFSAGSGTPTVVSKAGNGDLQFYPHLDGLYDLVFDYEQKGEPLAAYDDAPSLLPSKHHKILVWKALMELADFNNDRALYARANKRYLERLGWLMRDYLPQLKFETSRFYRW